MKDSIKISYRKFISKKIRKNLIKSTKGSFLDRSHVSLWKNKCKGDTFFILGSGSSINNIDNDQWGIIKNNTSIGLNYWCIHDFVPDFYLGEIPAGERGNAWIQNLINRLNDYKEKDVWYNIKIPYSSSHNHTERLNLLTHLDDKTISNVNLIPSFPIYTHSKKNVLKGVDTFIKKINQDSKVNFIPQVRGSIIGAYVLGVALGFKKIVFCGVDLNDTLYFYSENKSYYENLGRNVPTTGYAQNQEHSTIAKVENAMNVYELVDLLSKHFKESKNVGTYTINPKSKLVDILPIYEV